MKRIICLIYLCASTMLGQGYTVNGVKGEKTADPLLVPVPGGSFQMGSTTGYSYEQPIHSVSVASISIDKNIVTYEKWTEVRAWGLTHGYTDIPMGQNGFNPIGTNNPVTQVNWYDVVKWCNARSEKEELTPIYSIDNTLSQVYRTGEIDLASDAVKWTGNGYRLPTEAEWEFAARGGTQSNNYLYSGSNTADDVAWYSINSSNTTHTVGQKVANELGLYDMSGNVFEWCWDKYGTYTNTAQTNPQGPTIGTNRVLRGGSFGADAFVCRVACRAYNSPNNRSSNNFGFRCAGVAKISTLSISPISGPVGSSVIISSNNLGANQGTSVVRFGSVQASVTSWKDTSITTIVPDGVSDATTISVTVNGITIYSPMQFTVVQPMVSVIGGTFPMGSNDALDFEASPIHSVTLSSFNIDKYEITYEKWNDVRNWAVTHGYSSSDIVAGQNGGIAGGSASIGINNPVTTVNWYDILKWCNARSEKEGLTPVYYTNNSLTSVYRSGQIDIGPDAVKWTANGYRLPTETEWEFAARGGIKSSSYIFSGSNILEDVGWYNPNSGNTTHQVGSKAQNELGIYDMSGNVWEWCWEWYAPYTAATQTNPKGGTSGIYHVLRGGSFVVGGVNLFNCRTASRGRSDPNYRNGYDYGFRCVEVSSPSIGNISPSHGPIGTIVTISGGNFGPTQGSSTIKFGTFVAIPSSWSDTQIVVQVPISVVGVVTISVSINGTIVYSATQFTVDNPMVSVTGGTFQMGSTAGSVEEQPIHAVSVGPFNIDRYEITYDEWTEVRNWALTHGYTDLNAGENGYNPNGTNNPVSTVNWYDVVKWCNARSEKDGLTPVYYTTSALNMVYRTGAQDIDTDAVKWTANGYRLPTEAEWEYAARGGTKSNNYLYSGSNTIGDVAWYYNNSGTTTHTVGQKIANELGIYDMSGNVNEWCWDRFGLYSGGAQVDPKGPTSGNSRVLRGGSFTDGGVIYSRVASRSSYRSPTDLFSGCGFRCVSVSATLIGSILPTHGPAGTMVIINGTNFGATQGASTVKFGTVTATPSSWSDTQILVPVPAGTVGDVIISLSIHGATIYFGLQFTIDPAPAPNISFPTTLVFGSVISGASSQKKITIGNTGNAALVGSLYLPPNSGYTLSSSSLNVPVGYSQDIAVTFSPLVAQVYISSVTITHNAAGSPSIVNLSGAGATLDTLMVPVAGGTFQMGSPSTAGSPNERPDHLVTVGSFLIDKYEITYEKWAQVRLWGQAHGYTDLTVGGNGISPVGTNNPVTKVNWYDIIKWCNARSEMDGLIPAYYTSNDFVSIYKTGDIGLTTDAVKWKTNSYRLLTEAEWEFAAKGGTKSNNYIYSGSNTVGDVAWFNGNSDYSTHSVGQKIANELGIFDMSGNIWEWCWDWSGPYSSNAQTDPKGAANGSARVIRGGAFEYSAVECRSAYRVYGSPDYRSDYYGFRCIFAKATQIGSILPTTGLIGSDVIISGNSFGTIQGTSFVSFGTVKATVSSWSDTSIIAKVPMGTTSTVTISVVVNGITETSSAKFIVLGPPNSPTGLVATPVSSSQVNLTWTASASGLPTLYRIYRSSTAVTGYGKIDSVVASQNSYSNTGLSSNSIYWYRITAINSLGESAPSNEDSAKTFITPLPSITLSATVLSFCKFPLKTDPHSH